MSRHVFDCEMVCRVRVAIGYGDEGYFLEVNWLDADPAQGNPLFLYASKNDHSGADLDLDYYRDYLDALGLTVPRSMFAEVRKDPAGSDRFVHHYVGGRMVRTKK